MTSEDVRAFVEVEIGDDWSLSNSHGLDLRKCLVHPRTVDCRNTFPKRNDGRPMRLWVVLEEAPGERDGDLIVFDETQRTFGLAVWDGDVPVLLGFGGGFLDTLPGM